MTTTTKAPSRFGKKKLLQLGVEQSLSAHLVNRAKETGGFACWLHNG